MTETPAPLGHNNPPEETPPLTLQEQLAAAHKGLMDRIAELQTLCEAVPAKVETEDQFKPVSDLLKAVRVALSSAEQARKIENEEARKRVSMIDAFFKNPAEKLKEIRDKVKERADVYLEEKAAAEQRRRDEEARRKAAEAEEKRWDAIWAEARAELAVYDARVAEAKELAARLRKEAEARRADHLKNRAKRLAKVEPYLQARADRRRKAEEAATARRLQAIADERARLEAEGEERLRLEELDRQEAARVEARRVEAEKTKTAADEARKNSQAARREETSAGKAADKHIEAADTHAASADELGATAHRAEKRADRAERQANAGPAEMSRTRSDMGTTSSSARRWEVISVDRNVLDLNLLRGFLHPDAIDVAVRGYMMAHRNDPGGPKLEGAVFDQVVDGNYR